MNTYLSRNMRRGVASATILCTALSACGRGNLSGAQTKTIVKNNNGWIWDSSNYFDIVPQSDGKSTYLCAYYGEAGSLYKSTGSLSKDMLHVWSTYASGKNPWQSGPMKQEDVLAAINSERSFVPISQTHSYIPALPFFATGGFGVYLGIMVGSIDPFLAPLGVGAFALPGVMLMGKGAIMVKKTHQVRTAITTENDRQLSKMEGWKDSDDAARREESRSRVRVGSALFNPAEQTDAGRLDVGLLVDKIKSAPRHPDHSLKCKSPKEIHSELARSGIDQMIDSIAKNNLVVEKGVQISCHDGVRYLTRANGSIPGGRMSVMDSTGIVKDDFDMTEWRNYMRAKVPSLGILEKTRSRLKSLESQVATLSQPSRNELDEIQKLREILTGENLRAEETHYKAIEAALKVDSPDMVFIPPTGAVVNGVCDFLHR